MKDLPDIVVILNESTINPYNLDYPFVENFDFDFFKDNKYTKYSGLLNVNTFGESSWISKYEINTGIPHKLFKGPRYIALYYFSSSNSELVNDIFKISKL